MPSQRLRHRFGDGYLTTCSRWQASGGQKHYIYHLMALEAALAVEARAMAHSMGSEVGVGSSKNISEPRLSLPVSLHFDVAGLKSVSPSKTLVDAKTVLHWCGNKWCCNPGHFYVGSKVYNDEQTSCHKGLHNAESVEQYLGIQASYCKHVPKCWALPYGGAFDLTPAFCETGVLPAAEVLSATEEFGEELDIADIEAAGLLF